MGACMADRPGLKAALESRRDEVGSAGALASAGETPALPGFEPIGNVVTGDASGRKPGRPAGSSNLKGGRVAAFYLRTEGDPLLDLVRFARRDLLELVKELQGVATETGVRLIGKNQSLLDLIKEQRAAAEAALPYLHQRMPLAMEVDKGGRNVLVVGTPTPEQFAGAAQMGIDLRKAMRPEADLEGVQYQEVSADDVQPFPHDPFPHEAQDIDK